MDNNQVNHPKHYCEGKIEVIEFLEDKNLNFHRGNAVKYISRAGLKSKETEITDLKKAVWYLNREIELLESKKESRNPTRPNDMNPKTEIANLNPILEPQKSSHWFWSRTK